MLNVFKTRVLGRGYCIIHKQCLHVKNCFRVGPESGGRGPDGLFGVYVGGKYTRFECSFKPMSIPHGWSILAKQRDPDWSPYDFT